MAVKKAVNSRAKGGVGEREVVNLLKEYGFTAERTVQYCGRSIDSADVRCNLPGIHVEVKRYKKDMSGRKTTLDEWFEKGEAEAEEVDKQLVIFSKANFGQWYVYFKSPFYVKQRLYVPRMVRMTAHDFLTAMQIRLTCIKCNKFVPDEHDMNLYCKECES